MGFWSADPGCVPLVAHVIQRLGVGGMENGLVNLINHMPPERYRHAIVCLGRATDFQKRIERPGVSIIELHQKPGHDFSVHRRFWRALRELKPDIVHTRNLPALEFQSIAAFAGIRGRIHGEHGRDVYDLDGRNWKYNTLRRTMRPFVRHYTAVSKDLEHWLVHALGIKHKRVTQIYNGVEADRFSPRVGARIPVGPDGFMSGDSFVIGTVGRMEAVKDQLNLARAFIHFCQRESRARQRARLVIIGDGALRGAAMELLSAAGIQDLAWLPGERDDVAELMRAMDLFVLPSLREGISNTILEAMATGLAVVATRVGGNPELVIEERTGSMVPPRDPEALAKAIGSYFDDPKKAADHGQNGRRRIDSSFSMAAMVEGYIRVYDAVLQRGKTVAAAAETAMAAQRMH